MKIGYFLASEEFAPQELVKQAQQAEAAGFDGLWISDHFHPWNEAQGHSSFVWSTIGAIAHATSRMKVTTAVTCPTVRIHPAIIAQAAATSSLLLGGKFILGIGSGEALNEHIFGDPWPEARVRLEMLEEAVEVLRGLWEGKMYSHRGRHYRVQNAKIYDLPNEPPPIFISGFGKKSIALAARIADGYCLTTPESELVSSFRSQGGGDKPVAGGMKVCWAEHEKEARATAHRLWPTEQLPGELAQVLPMPAHFEQACTLISEQRVSEAIPCGPDLDRHIDQIEKYAQAGFDELYIQQIGGHHDRFFELYKSEVLPRFN